VAWLRGGVSWGSSWGECVAQRVSVCVAQGWSVLREFMGWVHSSEGECVAWLRGWICAWLGG